jgi:hypothetical protein
MTLQDIYDQLSYGELRMLALGSDLDNDEGMPEESFKKLFPSIQLALTALHTKFLLREGTEVVPLALPQVSYIIKPTKKDMLRIERVYGTYLAQEYEIPLNELDAPDSIRTSSTDTLLIPDDTERAPWLLETTELKVVYRQNHPLIKSYLANASPLITEIFLPATHLEPLLFHVASRMHNPLGMDPGAMHEGNNYMQKFEAKCQELKDAGFQITSEAVNDRLERNGWV